MVAGHLQEKNGYFYIVLSYKDENGKRKTPWFATDLPVKGNKKRAEAMLMELRLSFDPEAEEAARRIGKSQSAVANKLRLLRLPEQALELLRKNGFTERHARALLRLPTPQAQNEGAALVVKEGWTVSRTEQYVEAVLKAEEKERKTRRPLFIRDVRFFLNTVDHGLTVMRSAGVDAKCHRVEEGDAILLTIRIPKTKTGGANP